MKSIKLILVLFAFSLLTLGSLPVKAQCSLCSSAVESNTANGGKTSNGLNHGIVYLLSAPYVAIAAIGLVWYKKYRRKDVDLNVPHDKLNLN